MKEKDTLYRLLDYFPGLVHPMYPFPEPYIGSGEIKAIILGADPARMVYHFVCQIIANFRKTVHDFLDERKGFMVWKDMLEERLL